MSTVRSESDGVQPKERMASRLKEDGLLENRLIPVEDGSKASKVNHHKSKNRHSSFDRLHGNYGVYAGATPSGDKWLIDVDIDDYETDPEALDPVTELPETLTVASPHTDGGSGGHRYYAVVCDDLPSKIEDLTGKYNPKPSWGSLRTKNQYVVGPGSQLDGCDKEWCDKCEKPDGGKYEIAKDAPIAELDPEQVLEVLRADGYDGEAEETDNDDYTPDSSDTKRAKRVVEEERWIADYLALGPEDGDRSKKDFAVCRTMIEYGVPEGQVRDLLNESRHTKVNERGSDYWRNTWNEALRKADENSKQLPGNDGSLRRNPEGQPGKDTDTNPLYEKFKDALEYYKLNPHAVATTTNEDGETRPVGVETILPDPDSDSNIGDAVMAFNRRASKLDGTDKQAVIGRVVYLDLREQGEFFNTTDGRLYYFHDPEKEVYRVDDRGNRILTEDFQGMVWGQYNLFAGRFSRNLGSDLKRLAREDAPTKAVYQFAHYNGERGELYVSDWGSGYYAVTPTGIEWRSNGTDVYFLSDDMADSYQYLEPNERPELPNEISGERDLWLGNGDPVMRLFGNRINYDENAALGPLQQRKQLYIHLHTLPFIDVLNARPIMAWVGEKGSGKTVIERSIGQFIYGSEFRESVMPDAKDDFLAKVTNQTLAFLDNYDDGEEWANDVLAAIATGAGIDKRELYTTNTLRRETPRCWLSITSRDPPFRRDDVADRTLVFRVERVTDGFIGQGDYLRQVTQYRDLLWSAYLDNIKAVLEEYNARDTGTMSSAHRMADWAIFAKITADALGVDDVDELLETMETERATFALENEPWAAVISDWVNDDPEDAATWRKAKSLASRLSDVAESHNRTFGLEARGLGSKLSHYETELGELYNLEIDDTGRTNQYRFNVDTNTTTARFDRF